jgi:hypothetical protein
MIRALFLMCQSIRDTSPKSPQKERGEEEIFIRSMVVNQICHILGREKLCKVVTIISYRYFHIILDYFLISSPLLNSKQEVLGELK